MSIVILINSSAFGDFGTESEVILPFTTLLKVVFSRKYSLEEATTVAGLPWF